MKWFLDLGIIEYNSGQNSLELQVQLQFTASKTELDV